MKQIMTIFAFTFRDGVRKKSFIISTIIILALIVIVASIPAIIEAVDDDTTETTSEELDENSPVCYYLDEEGLILNGFETLSSTIKDTKFEKGDASKISEYKNTIKKDGKYSIIQINKGIDGRPTVDHINKDFMTASNTSLITEILSDLYISNTLAEQGIDKDTIAFAQSALFVNQVFVGDMDLSGYLLGLILTMLVFFAIYFYGYGVSMSVATEKTSRVIETLIVSAKPSRILIGKCLGMGFVGLFQFVLILLVGASCYQFLLPDGFMLFGMEMSLSAFTLKSAILSIVYFLLGYSLYAMMNAVSGAYVSKIEDLNSAMMPVMLVAMTSFYVGYFSILSPNNLILQKICMYMPFISPFMVPFNLLNSDIATMDLIISIAILIISIAIVTLISIRLYSASVLNYGTKEKKRKRPLLAFAKK